jgi:hypothetical protein
LAVLVDPGEQELADGRFDGRFGDLVAVHVIAIVGCWHEGALLVSSPRVVAAMPGALGCHRLR